MLTGLLWLHSQ